MIELSRLNGETIFINPELVRTIEKLPETVITFTDDKKIYVKESPAEISEKIRLYKQKILIN